MKTAFIIPLANVSSLKDRMLKLQTRANHLGVSFPFVEYGEPTKVEDRWVVRVNASGEGIDRPVAYGGWKIVAQFNHQYPQVIVNKLQDNINPEFIERFESANLSYCEHCKKSIVRNNTYAIEDADGNQTLVGSACMKSYVPLEKPLDSVIAFYGKVHDYFSESEECCSGHDPYKDTREFVRKFLQVCLAGFSRGSWQYELMYSIIVNGEKAPNSREAGYPEFQLYLDKRQEAEEMVDACLEYARALGRSEFEIRVSRIVECDYFLDRDSNTALWAALIYHRDMAKKAEREALTEQLSNQGYIGVLGEVFQGEVEFAQRIFYASGVYGDEYLYRFVFEGKTIIWKTGSYREFEAGEKLRMKARITEHSEYNGIQQTRVTRPTLSFI